MNYELILDYLQQDELLHIFTAIGIALLGLIILGLFLKMRAGRAELRGTQAALDSTRQRSERQAEEIRGWRRLFGPFVSLYENSPEATDGHNNNDATVAIDLDGVILEYVSPWSGIDHFGDPIPGAAEAIKKIRAAGYKVVIYTSRNNSLARHNGGHNALSLTALVQNELEKHGIPYDYISLFKPLARYYIDDWAIRFYDWPQALRAMAGAESARLSTRSEEILKTLGDLS